VGGGGGGGGNFGGGGGNFVGNDYSGLSPEDELAARLAAGEGDFGGDGRSSPSVDLDEELAFALMQQFAADMEAELGQEIPANVRADPALYDAFVHERFAAALQGNQDSELARRANNLIDSSSAAQKRGGKAGFLEQLRKRTMGVARPIMAQRAIINVVGSATDSKRTSLLSDQDNV